jgi:hypothetical protein
MLTQGPSIQSKTYLPVVDDVFAASEQAMEGMSLICQLREEFCWSQLLMARSAVTVAKLKDCKQTVEY